MLGKLDIYVNKKEAWLSPDTLFKSSFELDNLGVKAKIMKLLEENLGECLHHLSVGKNFLEHKIDKLKRLQKIKNFYLSGYHSHRKKSSYILQENIYIK